MKTRNTHQKEVILDVMKNNYNHPTISEIYNLVKKVDPSIGQATVYRNISRYVKDKKIFVITSRNGVNHYDFYDNCCHLECLKCGKIVDVSDVLYFDKLKENLLNSDKKISSCKLYIEGYCNQCKG